MGFEIFFKIFIAIGGIFSVGKIIYEMISGGKSKLREEYRFAKEFLRDSAQDKSLHPYVLEKGYYAIAGTSSIKVNEIAYLLSLENPVQCLNDYVLGRKYLEQLNTMGDLKITFAKKYKEKWSRRWRKIAYLAGYFFGAVIALSPLLVAKPFGLSTENFMILTLFTLPVFGFVAVNSMWSFMRIVRSEHLERNQNKHTRHIIIE